MIKCGKYEKMDKYSNFTTIIISSKLIYAHLGQRVVLWGLPSERIEFCHPLNWLDLTREVAIPSNGNRTSDLESEHGDQCAIVAHKNNILSRQEDNIKVKH